MADEDHDRASDGAGERVPVSGRPREPRRPGPVAVNVVAVVLALGAIAMGGHAVYEYQAEIRAEEAMRAARARGGGGGGGMGPRVSVKEENGKKLLWASGQRESEDSEWFDVTDAIIPPEKFNHGIGKDRIRAIDDPVFVDPGDKRLKRHRIDGKTPVIGYVHNGEAKAYPLDLMRRHELANDTIGGKPVTVGF